MLNIFKGNILLLYMCEYSHRRKINHDQNVRSSSSFASSRAKCPISESWAYLAKMPVRMYIIYMYMRTLDRGTIEHTTLHRSMFPCALIEYGRTFANKYCICRGKTWSKRLQGEGGFRSHPYPFPLLKSDELERCIKLNPFTQVC